MTWIRRHPIASKLVGALLALAALEGGLMYYYLNSWLTLPL